MPNMSRYSLESHHDRVGHMIDRDPAQEDYIRKRYVNSNYTEQRKRVVDRLTYDSGDEVDYRQQQTYHIPYSNNSGSFKKYQEEKESWFVHFITSVVTMFTNGWNFLTGSLGADQGLGMHGYSTPAAHSTTAQKGLNFFPHNFLEIFLPYRFWL